MRTLVAAAWLFGLLVPHAQACWAQAGQRHGIATGLPCAIARVESGLNPSAVNRSHWQRTGSYGIGLLQINSRLPLLARHGIQEADLFQPCTNIAVGAWLPADILAHQGRRSHAEDRVSVVVSAVRAGFNVFSAATRPHPAIVANAPAAPAVRLSARRSQCGLPCACASLTVSGRCP